MPEVKWLPEAVEDARRLFEFLDDKSPSAAAKVAQTRQKRLRNYVPSLQDRSTKYRFLRRKSTDIPSEI